MFGRSSLCYHLIIFTECGFTGKLVYFPFNNDPFVGIVHLLGEQHSWAVGESPRTMCQVSLPLSNRLFLCWCDARFSDQQRYDRPNTTFRACFDVLHMKENGLAAIDWTTPMLILSGSMRLAHMSKDECLSVFFQEVSWTPLRDTNSSATSGSVPALTPQTALCFLPFPLYKRRKMGVKHNVFVCVIVLY